MTVYVDRYAFAYGRMVMCHLIADTPAELRAMVEAIGVDPKWFQADASTQHFDISNGKRALAAKAGAVELDMRAFVATMKRIRATWPRAGGRWALP